MRVLLVEDDSTLADFVANGLREAGFVVDRAADGRTGLQKAAAGPHDAAIVDVMLEIGKMKPESISVGRNELKSAA